MKKAIHHLVNKIFKSELELLYGVGSNVEIQDLFFSTNKKIYIIRCKLFISDVKLYEEIGQDGLNFIFGEAWKFMGFYNKKFMLQISFELT
jgi:hypothetical protein